LSLARLLEAAGVDADAGRLLAQAETDEGVTVAAPRHRAGLPPEDVMLTVRAARGADGALTGYVVVAGAATVASGREAALRRLAALDPLTGILNRRAFLAAATRAVEQRRRLGGPLSVIAFDVDRFKALNDAHGHAAGDVALQRICEAAAAALRPDEPFGRIGGDEFAIVLPGVALADAVAVAQRIGEAAAALPGPRQVTLSLGVVERGTGDELFAETLARADAALYRAKAAGRDRVAAA
jgi:diguanylate cyclase (GGDEF)-like protein